MKRVIATIGITFLCLVLIWYGYKSYKTFKDSDFESSGFVVCNADKSLCEKSTHIHANIELEECGKQIYLNKEEGRTDKQHTHKELNRIHWHAHEKVDTTGEPLDNSDRTIKSLLTSVNINLVKQCGPKSSIIKVFINGVEMETGLDYVWKDEDKIKILVE